jgi:hypothetical protein
MTVMSGDTLMYSPSAYPAVASASVMKMQMLWLVRAPDSSAMPPTPSRIPSATPPSACWVSSSSTPSALAPCSPVMSASTVSTATTPVPSLNRLSPAICISMLGVIPTRRRMPMTATGSVGDTTAPSNRQWMNCSGYPSRPVSQ